jgi:dipeptidyl aminopeptidase/acylaminoacyl peptidase
MRRHATLTALLTCLVMAGATSSAPHLERLPPHSDLAPIWNAEGTKIAFIRNRSTAWELRAIAATGGTDELHGVLPIVAHRVTGISPVAISPDLSTVAFRAGNRLLRIADVERSTSFDISLHPHSLSWSPDGRFLAVGSDLPSEIYVVRADGSGLRKVADGAYPSWSPGGDRLAFVAFPNIAIVERDGTGRRTVWQTTGWSGPAAWSPAGDRLAFPSNHVLRVVRLDGMPVAAFRGVYATNIWPSWSFDGRRLAISSNRFLSVFDLTTRREKRFPHAWSASWAPGTNLFAAASLNRCSWPGIHVSSAFGTFRRLTLDCRIDGTGSGETLEGTEWRDVISGRGGSDRILGGGDADTLLGGPGNDRIFGRSGSDVLRGGAGRDVLSGGNADDWIHARDGERDRISCWRGRDIAWVDRFDRVAPNCETVRKGPT